MVSFYIDWYQPYNIIQVKISDRDTAGSFFVRSMDQPLTNDYQVWILFWRWKLTLNLHYEYIRRAQESASNLSSIREMNQAPSHLIM